MIQIKKIQESGISKNNEPKGDKKKSKFVLWREKYPEGLEGTIVNMRAVLR
jgi:hypothetical protein